MLLWETMATKGMEMFAGHDFSLADRIRAPFNQEQQYLCNSCFSNGQINPQTGLGYCIKTSTTTKTTPLTGMLSFFIIISAWAPEEYCHCVNIAMEGLNESQP